MEVGPLSYLYCLHHKMRPLLIEPLYRIICGTGEGNGNPLQCSCLENPRDGGAWWAAVYGVAQSRTRLKRLSSNSIGLTQPLYRNNCYTTGCWLSHFYGMTWRSLKTWKIVYFSSDLDKGILYEKFKGINWPLHCNYLYYFICDGMLGRKHLKTFGLVHLGHNTLSDLINIPF